MHLEEQFFPDKCRCGDDRECLSRLWYTRQQSDLASWYKVWEAVTAVYSVCARNQQKGTIRGLGQ